MNKYLVLEWDDIMNSGYHHEVGDIVTMIHKHRMSQGLTLQDNDYLVVNKNEPYADKVRALIEDYDRQKFDDIRKRILEQCDGIIHTSAGGCLADKEIQILTNYDGDFPSSSDIDRHLRAIYDITHEYNKTLHRATNPPRNGQIKTRLMVGQADLMLNDNQVNALNISELGLNITRPVEILLTPSAPKQRRNTDV